MRTIYEEINKNREVSAGIRIRSEILKEQQYKKYNANSSKIVEQGEVSDIGQEKCITL